MADGAVRCGVGGGLEPPLCVAVFHGASDPSVRCPTPLRCAVLHIVLCATVASCRSYEHCAVSSAALRVKLVASEER